MPYPYTYRQKFLNSTPLPRTSTSMVLWRCPCTNYNQGEKPCHSHRPDIFIGKNSSLESWVQMTPSRHHSLLRPRQRSNPNGYHHRTPIGPTLCHLTPIGPTQHHRTENGPQSQHRPREKRI
ncbi:hypothetical protein AVEN_64351-1 [Araneus ventricosus]|uniref:Uncharacterized protein n=1 Tax=Araneus ventricosus TaxID=182803 RepID=A0A4Y2DA68_ARAVE|nr:hypothetical protein AVEN_64351-1 [Araneus ventricosus]